MEKLDILLRFIPEGNKQGGEDLAEGYKNLALLINSLDMDSREKTIAMERLEESYMWATKGLYYEE